MKRLAISVLLALAFCHAAEACPCKEGDLTYSDEEARQCAYFIQTHQFVRPCVEEIRAGEARLRIQVEATEAAKARIAEKSASATVTPDPATPASADDRGLLPLAPPPTPQKKVSAAEKQASAARKRSREERAAAAKAEKAEKDRQLQEIVEQADAEFCGPAPKRSAWDGVYAGLKDAVKSAAHDPDSIDFVGCTDLVKKRPRPCWVTSCRYRGKNALGAKVLATEVFSKTHNGWSSLGE